MKQEKFIGLSLDQALELVCDKNVIIKDISHPDKYHEGVKATKRVIKATEAIKSVTLFVADFVDEAEKQ